MNKQYLLNYIIDFMVENNWGDDHVPEQIRAIFTTWCFLHKINADTKECDEALQILYRCSTLGESICCEEFETFMIELMV